MQNAAQPVAAAIELILLTHATEFSKSTNTGALVAPALENQLQIIVKRLPWSRVAPDPQLLTVTAANPLWLLYPTPEALVLDADMVDNAATTNLNPCPDRPSATVQRFILLDATWQLAHKMYRQSPYLQALPTLSLQSSQASQYLLRRNQRQQGWCTAESVALLLSATGHTSASQNVSEAFMQFNQRK
jgi:DTW domain-containing protein YfiP